MIDEIWKLNPVHRTAKRIAEMELTDTPEHKAAQAGAIALVAEGQELIIYRGYLGDEKCYWKYYDLDESTYTFPEDGSICVKKGWD